MFPWNPDLNIQLSAQHFRLMSNRISNLIFPKPNCWSSNVLPLKSTPLQLLHLRKWPLHPSSCSVKQNSWCLFSLTHSPPVNIVSLTLRIDTGSNHCSHILYTSTLWWKGQARQPLSDLTCEPPRYAPPARSPYWGLEQSAIFKVTRWRQWSHHGLSLWGSEALLTWNTFPRTSE